MRIWADILVKPPCLRDSAGHTQSELYPGIRLQIEEKSRRNLSLGSQNFRAKQLWYDSLCRFGHNLMDDLDWRAELSHVCLHFKWPWSNLGQLKYLPSCRTNGFNTPAKFESKLSFRALMWLAKNGNSRSLRLCLLPAYQGEPVAMRSHLDWSTSNYLMWVRVADLQMVHGWPVRLLSIRPTVYKVSPPR